MNQFPLYLKLVQRNLPTLIASLVCVLAVAWIFFIVWNKVLVFLDPIPYWAALIICLTGGYLAMARKS